VTPAGEFTFFMAPGFTLESITPGRGASLLFTEFGSDRIARITVDGVIQESPEIPGSAPTGIALGPAGSIWFLGYGDDQVYRLTFP
jgi:virginiamycin B lyase